MHMKFYRIDVKFLYLILNVSKKSLNIGKKHNEIIIRYGKIENWKTSNARSVKNMFDKSTKDASSEDDTV